MKSVRRLLYIISTISLLVSCKSTKFVGNGEYLLDKVVIDSDNKDYRSSELKSYLRQQPNFKAFGLMKWQLYVYNWSGRNDNNWVNKQLRRIGEAPVIMDTLLVEKSVEELSRFFVNKGYLHPEVTALIDTSRNKKAVVTYQIQSNQPHRIEEYTIDLYDPVVDSIAHLKSSLRGRFSTPFRNTLSDDYASLVKEGGLFDRDVLDKERQRITTLLRRRGYYAFNRDYLRYEADTTIATNAVDLEMVLRPYRRIMPDGTIREEQHQRYRINSVTVLTDYDPLRIEEQVFTPTDTVWRGDLRVIYGQRGRSIRPGVLRRANYLQPGRLYSDRTLDQTYNAYGSLNALRNVNIRFEEVMVGDSLGLDAYILTSPTKVHGIGFDVEGTNSAGDFGFAASTNYQHRNFFKGSELFTVRLRGAYESLRHSNAGLKSYWEIRGETSLTFPHFIFPFLTENFKRRLRATTEFRFSYNRQTRPEYERAIISGGWNYRWQSRINTLARHTFKLLDVDYMFLPRIDNDFFDDLPETTQQYYYRNQFIVGAGYTYSYNSFNPQNRQRDTQSFRIALDAAGNLLYTFSNVFGTKKDEEGYYNLFGINYSQFVKIDVDYSKGYYLSNRNRLAYHIGGGVVVPYGNASQVPFERRYFAGGANSVRGWSVRSLGPGSMSTKKATFVTQSGDIRLDASIEYRSRLFWKFELATFLDAGNIWTIRKYDYQKNGDFTLKRFYKEIAFAYGLGLRLDFDFFLVRLDGGFKAYDPQAAKNRRWAITRPNFGNNFALHFAVGYPF